MLQKYTFGALTLNLEVLISFSHILPTQSQDSIWQPSSHKLTYAPLTLLPPPSPGDPLSAPRAMLPGAVDQVQQFNSYFKRELTGRQNVDFTQIYSEIWRKRGVCFIDLPRSPPVKRCPGLMRENIIDPKIEKQPEGLD